MIIDISKSGYQRGYLPKEGVGVFHPFFATANCAVRRDALAAAGPFDERCRTGEDIDISIRIARAGYELWFEPTARTTHHHRHTLRGLLKQWFTYGLGHAYLYKKHGDGRRLAVYRYDLSESNPSPFGIRRVLAVPFPVRSMIFLSSFHLMHGALALALAAFALGALAPLPSGPVALARAIGPTALVVSLLAALWYFAIRFDASRPWRSIVLSGIRYVADAAYVLGGFLGGLRERMIYVEATRTRRRPRNEGRST